MSGTLREPGEVKVFDFNVGKGAIFNQSAMNLLNMIGCPENRGLDWPEHGGMLIRSGLQTPAKSLGISNR